MGVLDRFRGSASGAAVPRAESRDDAPTHIREGNLLEDQGRAAEALRCYDEAVRLAPDMARAHLNRGNALLALNDAAGATEAYARAIALEPDLAAAHFNLGNALQRGGRRDEAMSAYRRALAAKPGFCDAEVALGVVQHDAGQLEEAEASYRRALALAPDYAEVHGNLGQVLAASGRLEEAEACFRRALAQKPAYAKAVRGLGEALWMQGKLDAAVEAYRQALAADPGMADVWNELGSVLQFLGTPEEALTAYARALALDPRFVEAHSNAGRAHLQLRHVQEAIDCQRQAIAIKPGYAEAHFNLANALRDGGRLGEAIASYRRALAINPSFAIAYAGLGDVQKDLGSLGDAQASFRHALAIDPSLQEAHTSLLFCMSHDETVTPEALFAEHLRFGERFEAPLRAGWPAHANVRDPARRLNVGFVSGDLRAHPVAYFIEPLLPYLAADEGLALHAYSNHAEDDAVSRRLRPHFRTWKPVVGMPDERLAALVADDAIDVLIDLSGHTGRNRLRTFARKPAPVQASWIGYPGTTGLSAMDYYIADEEFLPTAEFAGQFTEKLVHLPATVTFLPEAKAPPVNALPALANGYVTFGSFNRPSKVRPAAVALWAQLMRALPTSRMLLGAMQEDRQHAQITEWFAAEGIAADRLTFHLRSDVVRYLALHREVDLCLDTFPYSGGTTTAHALWMGVPTLTVAGHTPPGRHGATILGHAGLRDIVAVDAADYLQKGLALAADLGALAQLRAQLRERCKAAAFSQPDAIAAALVRALRVMWQRWCAGLPPEAFAVTGDDAARRS